MKLAICDDSTMDRQTLIGNLEALGQYSHETELREFESGEELITALNGGYHADVVFLDIEMQGMDGMQTANLLRQEYKNLILVFVTSHSEQMLQAFDYEAFHFIIKPYTEQVVRAVLEKICNKHRAMAATYTITWQNETRALPIKRIQYVERVQKHLVFHVNREEIKTVGTLEKALAQLREYDFIQCHQGFLVSLQWVDKFEKECVVLQQGDRVPISVRKRADVLQKYADFVRRR